MKELVVISGKGGAGKTSVVAGFAALAEKKVLADCDVDAADLHLVLRPRVEETHDFQGGKRARVLADQCVGCGRCEEVCRFHAVRAAAEPPQGRRGLREIDPIACEGCGVCAWNCPADAIAFEPVVNGQWFISSTRFGPMVHAKLGVAEENTGKLVTLVRAQAQRIARREGADLVLIDGSPGIGCPVIASIAGASLALAVTEPTVSGLHDLRRVCELTAHFQIPTVVCINKCDLNAEVAERIRREAAEVGAKVVGQVRYDPAVTQAQLAEQSLIEFGGPAAEDVRALWENVQRELT